MRRAGAARGRAVFLVDALVSAVLLGSALAVLVGLAARALTAQSRGDELRVAAMLLDERLNLVMAAGPETYATAFESEGVCEAPFTSYRYRVDVDGGQAGDAYRVKATISWFSGGRERSESVETLMAARLGDDPDPIRKPKEAIDRW